MHDIDKDILCNDVGHPSAQKNTEILSPQRWVTVDRRDQNKLQSKLQMHG